MTTFLVCPICGMLPADNGTNTAIANNVVPTYSDAVASTSGCIGSTTSTDLKVATGSNFTVGDFIQLLGRKEIMQVTAIATNDLTVLRAQKGTVASGGIALNDVIRSGLDARGNAPHCPVCGTAVLTMNSTLVTTATGVSGGSQVPADADATYVTAADSPLAQTGTSYTMSAVNPLISHTYAKASGVVNRGTATVTPETLNSTLGP